MSCRRQHMCAVKAGSSLPPAAVTAWLAYRGLASALHDGIQHAVVALNTLNFKL